MIIRKERYPPSLKNERGYQLLGFSKALPTWFERAARPRHDPLDRYATWMRIVVQAARENPEQ